MKKTTYIISLCLTLLAAMAGIARAAVIIPVQNASFEDGPTYSKDIPPNPSPQLGIQDWFHEWGWADVRAASNPGVTGSRALLLGANNGGQVGQFFDSTNLVQANSTYTFSAMVGKYSAGNPGVGARLRMVFTTTPGTAVQGTTLDYGTDPISFYSSILNPASTTLETISMSIDTSVNTNLVGRYMAINLITIGTGDWDNYQTWDNVGLSYSAIPEPSAFWMMLGVIGALALLRRRSRTA